MTSPARIRASIALQAPERRRYRDPEELASFMAARYDLQCPHRRCTEPVIEIAGQDGKKGYICKAHGPITPGNRTKATKEAEK